MLDFSMNDGLVEPGHKTGLQNVLQRALTSPTTAFPFSLTLQVWSSPESRLTTHDRDFTKNSAQQAGE
eukprot:930077-Pelagomonas_calceolata.AAC.3